MPAIGTAISLIVGAIGTAVTAIGATAVGSFFLRLGATVALSALARALAPKPCDPGIQTQSTQVGGVNPLSFVLGTYATAGTLVAPPLTHGPGLAYLTYVIALGAVPGQTLCRVAINDEWVDLDADNAHPDYGFPPEAGSKYVGKLWVRFYDGSQSAVDPMLLSMYETHPDYPWSASVVGQGLAYAICTFVYDRTIYSGLPKALFELGGIPLYDLRKGDTLGGTGTHRWTDRSTWEATDNPVVMIYNILRGISVGADIWGGGVAGGDLPFDPWVVAMTAAEAAVSLANGTTEPAWCAGFEVRVDEEPLGIIDELLKACSGDLSNTGGTWTIRIGAPALPVLSITDDYIIITEDQQLNPFPGLDATFNGVTAQYPEPVSLYQSREAPPRYNTSWEDDDGNRRLVADLSLPAVPHANQVQRLMRAYIEDERRFIRHTLTLPPMAIQLEPLDTISWSSERNGYVAKLFEVASVMGDPLTLLHRVTMRERDATDYNWAPGYELPANPVLPSSTLPLLLLSGFAASPSSIKDGAGTDRRPALALTWDGDQPRATGLEWELRLAGGATVVTGSVSDVARGAHIITRGLVPATAYEVRARLVADIAAGWTGWVAITTGDVRITSPDIDPGAVTWSELGQDVQDQIDSAGDAHASAQLAANAQVLAENARNAAQTAGNSATTQAGIAVSAKDDTTRIYELSGPVDLAEPIGIWTSKSTDSTADKAALVSGIVTGDADFGECYAFPGTSNVLLGQRSGHPFDPGRIYEVTYVWKVAQDGTGGNTVARFGFSTMTGGTSAQSNIQTGNHTHTVADGPRSTTVQFGKTGVVDGVTQALTGADDYVTWSASSDAADRIFFHIRQNSGSTDGIIRVDSVTVRDVTGRIQSAQSAQAAAVSESSAAASETAAGQSAIAAQTERTLAETAQSGAESAQTNAATSETNAAGSAASAASSADLAVQSANSAATHASNASVSAASAATSESSAAGSASSASSSASLASTSQSNAASHASNASVSENIAAVSATNAGDAASGAIAARDVAARIYGGEAFSNPILEDWSGTYPDGFTNASVSEGSISKVTGKYGNALRLVNTSSPPTTNRPYIQLRDTTTEVTLPSADTCTGIAMTVELSKVSGYWANGGCVRIQWLAGSGGTSASTYFFFEDFAGGRANGDVFPMEIVALRPDSYVAGTTAGEVRIFFYATSTFSGHTRQNGKFDIHRVSIRELTNAAHTSFVQKAITDLQGNAAASFVLRAKAGGAIGAVEIVAADDALGGAASKVLLTANEIELAGDVLTSGNITSTNYAENGSGNPTAGYKLGLDGTIKAREVIATNALQNNAVTVTRYSSGLKDESITWTPAHNSEVVIMVFYDLVVAGGTNNDWAKYAILKDGVEQTYRQINGYFNGGQDRGTIVARVSATANSSITIKADWSFASGSGIPSNQFYGSCDLIVFEAKK